MLSDAEIKALLGSAKTIAIVGLSAKIEQADRVLEWLVNT
jgi:predicted CoA-binding protein